MDLLKQEVERKRKVIGLAKQSYSVLAYHYGGSKYLRASDLRRFQEECKDEERTGRSCFCKKRRRRVQEGSEKDGHYSKEDKHITLDETMVDDFDDHAETLFLSSGSVGCHHAQPTEDNETPITDPEEPPLPTMNKSTGGSIIDGKNKSKTISMTITNTELTHALRDLGIPVRLFGERYDTRRTARLHEARESRKVALAGMSEMDEFRLGKGHGIRNTFLGGKKTDEGEKELDAGKAKMAEGKEEVGYSSTSMVMEIHYGKRGSKQDDDVDDPHKCIHRFFKSILRHWEEELIHRPEVEKRTTVGRNETKTLKQCRDYIRPLFKLLKNRRIEGNIMEQILKIVDCCKEGEFVRAHDAYMNVAIGRAAWPIGVTMVGIHARTGRAKIESANVAHVMNSELQRKYLTSIKRLMTYFQKKQLDVAPSKKVMN